MMGAAGVGAGVGVGVGVGVEQLLEPQPFDSGEKCINNMFFFLKIRNWFLQMTPA
jgi:hypothetical protein